MATFFCVTGSLCEEFTVHRSPNKVQWRRALLFSLICAWINVWVNNRKAHYDVTVMCAIYHVTNKVYLLLWRILLQLSKSDCFQDHNRSGVKSARMNLQLVHHLATCFCWDRDDVIKWKHFLRYWPFVRGIHWSHGALMFSSICVWLMSHHDDVIKWKHFPRYWPFVRGIHRSPVNSPHKGQRLGALMFLWPAS